MRKKGVPLVPCRRSLRRSGRAASRVYLEPLRRRRGRGLPAGRPPGITAPGGRADGLARAARPRRPHLPARRRTRAGHDRRGRAGLEAAARPAVARGLRARRDPGPHRSGAARGAKPSSNSSTAYWSARRFESRRSSRPPPDRRSPRRISRVRPSRRNRSRTMRATRSSLASMSINSTSTPSEAWATTALMYPTTAPLPRSFPARLDRPGTCPTMSSA